MSRDRSDDLAAKTKNHSQNAAPRRHARCFPPPLATAGFDLQEDGVRIKYGLLRFLRSHLMSGQMLAIGVVPIELRCLLTHTPTVSKRSAKINLRREQRE